MNTHVKTCDTKYEARQLFGSLARKPGVTFSSLAGRRVRWKQRQLPLVSRVVRTSRKLVISFYDNGETTSSTRHTAKAYPFAVVGRLACGELGIMSCHWDRPSAAYAVRIHTGGRALNAAYVGASDLQIVDLFAMEK